MVQSAPAPQTAAPTQSASAAPASQTASTAPTIAIAAGGTAGHINPALALAEELKKRGIQVVFFGQPTRLEATLVPEAGFDFVPIDVVGFDRSRPWTLFEALNKMRRAQKTVASYFTTHPRPQAAIGFGAYVELPLLNWCHKAGIPTLIHEQNSVPGLANKTSASKAKMVCVSLPVAIDAFKPRVSASAQIVVTGNPVRQSVIHASRDAGRTRFNIPQDATLVLVFGGSLGAHHINERLLGLKDRLLQDPKVYVIHSTGTKDYDTIMSELTITPVQEGRWQLMPYIDNMGEALAASDFVVSRSGASSVAEIAATARPSILVPYPYATADHQTTNARYLVDAHAAYLVPDSELDEPRFEEVLFELLENKEQRAKMSQAARALGQDKAAFILVDQVMGVAGIETPTA